LILKLKIQQLLNSKSIKQTYFATQQPLFLLTLPLMPSHSVAFGQKGIMHHGRLWDDNWNIHPHGQAYIDIVYKTCWADEEISSNEDGKASIHAFCGDYKIFIDRVSCLM
jgi:hypothetical protein